jgi:hypothetical protein
MKLNQKAEAALQISCKLLQIIVTVVKKIKGNLKLHIL